MRVSRPALAALVVGLLITGGLSALGYTRNAENERRLLRLQTQEAGAILQLVVPVVETPLSSAAQIAVTTSGKPTPFNQYIAPFVGTKGPFAAASLWTVGGTTAQMITAVGTPLVLDRARGAAGVFLAEAARRPGLHITGPVPGPSSVDRLGYAFAARAGGADYVVYAESLLPPHRRAPDDPNSPLASLRYALYIGSGRGASNLLESNTDDLPITGRTASVTEPFGDQSLTLITTPERPLAGSVTASLWWILLIAGALISIGAAGAAERLTRRRLAAEELTANIRDLLGKQRTIAEALQRALLPEGTPSIDGVEVAARYFPGEHGLEIGGDWYDVVRRPNGRLFFVVGDVSGRGVRAGSVMGALRFAIRAFVSEGHSPPEVLRLLGPVIAEVGDGLIATVLCGEVDVAGHQVVLATAGHPPPLCVDGEHAEYVDIAVGPPVGARRDPHYESTTVRTSAGTTVIAYTDGLVERREEALDRGLERLRTAAAVGGRNAEDTADALVAALVANGTDDDTAVLVIQWHA